MAYEKCEFFKPIEEGRRSHSSSGNPSRKHHPVVAKRHPSLLIELLTISCANFYKRWRNAPMSDDNEYMVNMK